MAACLQGLACAALGARSYSGTLSPGLRGQDVYFDGDSGFGGRCNYIPTFQCLKKSRSHASIAQSPDEIVGHTQHVASAPINYRNSCCQDTEVPACCGQVSALPGEFEYTGRPLVMRLRPSASSSTALSCDSGASSPALRDPCATEASVATARLAGGCSGFEHHASRLSPAVSAGANCGSYDISCCSSGTGMGPAAPAASCQPSTAATTTGATAPACVATRGQNTPHGPGTDSLPVRGPPGPLPQGSCASPTHAHRSPLATFHRAATTPSYSPMQMQDDFLPDTVQSPQQQGPVYDTAPLQSNGSAAPQPMATDTSCGVQPQPTSMGLGLRPCAGHTSVPGIPCTSCHGSPTAGYRVTGDDLAVGLPGQSALDGLVATMASQPSAGGAGARGSAASREDVSSDSIRELWSAVQTVSTSLRGPAAGDLDAMQPLAGQIPLPGFASVGSGAGPLLQQQDQAQGASANEPPIALPSIRTRISAPVVPASPSGSAANSPARVGATAAAVFAARRSGLARTTSLLPEPSAQHAAHVQFQHHYPQHDHHQHHHHDGPTSTLASPQSRPPPPYMSNGHDAFTHRQHNHRSPNAAAAYDSQLSTHQHHQQYPHHSHQHHHDEFAPYPRPHHQQTLPAALLGLSYTTYGYRRARSTALESYGMTHGLGSSGHLATSDESSEEDDQEEATRRITQAFRTHTGMAGSSGRGLLGADTAPSTPTGICGEPGSRGTREAWVPKGSDTGNGSGREDNDDTSGDDGTGVLARKRSSYHLTNSHAAVELFLRLNHARQTMDFAKRQATIFGSLDRMEMTVWEALAMLNELREYEAVLMAEAGEAQAISELSLLDHAYQTAELCRLHHPDLDWLHLAGLLHGLGKLLAHRKFGSQPQWAICGETYPLGCRFSPHILGHQYFTANPDRRRRGYNTATGTYQPGCGLQAVVMSWSAPEYLYTVLTRNRTALPKEALFVLRHHKFVTLTLPHSCYLPLCSQDDLRMLPLLRSFQTLCTYKPTALPEGAALQGEQRTRYYTGLVDKYIGVGERDRRLCW